jgi:hypothetical protein
MSETFDFENLNQYLDILGACTGCHRIPPLEDEDGACHGNGWLCPSCGHYLVAEPPPLDI